MKNTLIFGLGIIDENHKVVAIENAKILLQDSEGKQSIIILPVGQIPTSSLDKEQLLGTINKAVDALITQAENDDLSLSEQK